MDSTFGWKFPIPIPAKKSVIAESELSITDYRRTSMSCVVPCHSQPINFWQVVHKLLTNETAEVKYCLYI